jgi:hypothetical protein
VALRPNSGHGLLIQVSRSHTMHHSRQDSSGRVISSSQRPPPDNTRKRQTSMPRAGIRTRNLRWRAAADLSVRPRGHWGWGGGGTKMFEWNLIHGYPSTKNLTRPGLGTNPILRSDKPATDLPHSSRRVSNALRLTTSRTSSNSKYEGACEFLSVACSPRLRLHNSMTVAIVHHITRLRW